MRKPAQQIAEATIAKLSHDGRGIAHINGKITFIEGALPGEEVSFVYTQRRSKYDEGRITEVKVAAALRAEAKCLHYGVCGGCNLQHLQVAAQLTLKQEMLLEQLSHFGNITPEQILPPLTGPVWEYRRKARLGIKYVAKKSAVLVGFREKDSRYLADLVSCEVLHPSVGKKLPLIKQLIGELAAFQTIPQIEVAIGDNATALIVRHLEPLSDADLAKLSQFAQQQQLQLFLQPGGMETIHPLWPLQPEALYYRLPDFDLTLQFKPSDFTQVNVDINRRMVSYAIELLAPAATDRILDLFCGLGNFTLPLARHCQQVVGVEGDVSMVARGYENARLNGIDNAEFYAADLSKDFASAAWAKQGFDKILLDPPRTGALQVIQYLSAFNARRIVYVSCNPATLARDAGVLVRHGYRLTKVGIMDMFPHTRHVESIAVFELNNK